MHNQATRHECKVTVPFEYDRLLEWQEVHLAPLSAQTQVLVGPVPAVSSYTFEANRGWTAVPLHS